MCCLSIRLLGQLRNKSLDLNQSDIMKRTMDWQFMRVYSSSNCLTE